jgi:hypothetical protein
MSACKKNNSASLPFEDVPVLYPVTAGVIDEASGIADSYTNANSLWVIQDSKQPTAVYLLNHNGQHGKKMFIKNVTNRDWEELAVSTGPVAGKNYLYIAETGDNDQAHADYIFYRMEEPVAATDTITQVDKIAFRYDDGSHDAEAFFVDPATKDIYIITKRDAASKVYRIAYPQSTTALNTATHITDMPFTGAVAASYSIANKELVIKTYGSIYYYKQTASQSITDLLRSAAISLSYIQEPQGEAICFSNNNTGFFTLSEKTRVSSVSLNFYKRK